MTFFTSLRFVHALSILAFATTLVGCGGSTEKQSTQPKVSLLANSQSVSNHANFSLELDSYNLTKLTVGYNILEKNNSAVVQYLAATIERLHFADTSLALDVDGNAGKIFRLYQAAFGRIPDSQGLAYWIDAVDKGATLEESAAAFIQSTEFERAYGKNPSNELFLNRLYLNILQRAGDSAGLNYWLDLLQRGHSRAAVLAAFAESGENKAIVAPKINAGIRFSLPNIDYRPLAKINAAQNYTLSTTIKLDGSASSDANLEKLNYQWTLLSKPALSNASLSSTTVSMPSLIADQIGRYEVSLTVNDGKFTSSERKASFNVFSSAMSVIVDNGHFRCSELSAGEAYALYFSGHLYLDRDADGKPCETNDKTVEVATVPVVSRPIETPPSTTPPVVIPPIYVPPVVTPTSPPHTGMCWVNGYTRKNGTRVNGYYRRC